MIKWVKEHSLGIVLTGLWFGLTGAAFLMPEGPVQQYVQNIAGDSYGAWVIVILSKWLIEKGSAESK